MRKIGDIDLSDLDVWVGGYYEAAIVLGACTDPEADTRLHSAISEIWSLPNIGSCSFDPSGQGNVIPAAEPLDRILRLYGWFHDREAGAIPFTTVVVRESEPDGQDWLYAALPFGGLQMAIPSVSVASFDLKDDNPWVMPIERSLADIALAVSRKVPFLIAAIGEEIAGYIEEDAFNGVFSDCRRIGYVAPCDGAYRYLPNTVWNRD